MKRDELVAQLRADMIGKGVPAGMADETLDLAQHAAHCAAHELFEVCERGGTHLVRENAISLALSLCCLKWGQSLAELAAEFQAAGPGHHVAEIVVQGPLQ